jgi:cytochrome P450
MLHVEPADVRDVFAPEHRRDPHPLYHWTRDHHPVWYGETDGEWLLTRWADCEAVLRDTRWSSNPQNGPPREEAGPNFAIGVEDVGARSLLFLDPPDHTRLRRLVSKAFTPRRVEQIRGHVGDITDALLTDAGLEAAPDRSSTSCRRSRIRCP